MQDFQQRVIKEKEELDEKTSRLEKFFTTPIALSVGQDERDRLNLQLFHMKKYSEVLGERIAAFRE